MPESKGPQGASRGPRHRATVGGIFGSSAALGGNQAGFADGCGLGGGVTQTGSLEIRPRLLRAIAAYRADVDAVSLGESHGHAGFDLRGKPGRMVRAAAMNAATAIAERALIMTVPCHLGLCGPV